MSKKIIVAGLGHGGIAVAALLSQQGYDVTVYEKKKKGTLGYDWTDIFDPSALGIAGMGMPPKDKFEYKEDMTFFPPSEKKSLLQHVPVDKREIKMERRDIYNHFIENALNSGVKIEYGCEIEGPVMLGNRVVGIRTSKGEFYGDLVIDACGMNSPVRMNLPDSLGIEKEVGRKEKITIYRAFFNKASDCEVPAKFKVMLYAGGVMGISWVASEEEHTDLLMGRFEDFDMDDVEEFTGFLRKRNPRLGTKKIRGGQFVEIPVRHTLAVMVADGYAAIGDSAFMPVPLIGSGIANALKAARILADVIIADETDSFSAEKLWDYQVKYYKALGSNLAPLECVKYMLFDLTPDEVDYCFETGILTDENITMSADFGKMGDLFKFDIKDLSNKAVNLCKKPVLLKKIGKVGVSMAKVVTACASIPKKWDAQRVADWAEFYTNAFKQ